MNNHFIIWFSDWSACASVDCRIWRTESKTKDAGTASWRKKKGKISTSAFKDCGKQEKTTAWRNPGTTQTSKIIFYEPCVVMT